MSHGKYERYKMIKLFIFIFIFLYFIFDLLMGFFITKFIINLIKTIPIFIRDLFIIDWKVFRGYGFWCYCGLGGSGKTLSMVNQLLKIKKKYPDVKILTNFNFKYADGKIESWRDLLNTTNFKTFTISEKTYLKYLRNHVYKDSELWLEVSDEKDENDEFDLVYKVRKNCGVVFGFDEIHLTFESTRWQDAPCNVLDYISQQRKLHKQILSSSQVFTRIDKKLREQTNYVIDCFSLFLGRLIVNKKYRTTEYIANDEKMDKGSRKRKVKSRMSYIAYDSIRNTYDTHQIMKDLNEGKSETQIVKDFIKKVGENNE